VKTPEMAVRFEKAFGGGADMWLRVQAAHDLAKVRQSQEKIAVRRFARPV
jgi:plasmid maintenance system antidote protein VapI